MTKFTINDLVEQGYYKNLASIARFIGVTRQIVYVWNSCHGGVIPERYVDDICECAAKPLKPSKLSIRYGGCQTVESFTPPPKIADRKLSTYLLTQAGIKQ